MGINVYKGAVASYLVRSTPDREVPDGALVRDILLCLLCSWSLLPVVKMGNCGFNAGDNLVMN